jgi:rhodanese-related sulfurtransferase
MRNILKTLMLALTLSAFMPACQSQPASGTQTLNAPAYEEAMKKNPGAIILDVRTPGEVQADGVLEGAIVIDFYDPKFMEKVNKLDKTKPIFIYCRSGARSGRAMDMMQKAGFVSVVNLQGGTLAWLSSGRKLKA